MDTTLGSKIPDAPSFDVVVSAENNRYMQWQAMVFHYSCLRVLGRPPIVVVHVDDEPLMPGFRLILQRGGVLQFAPTQRYVDGIEYPPRNTAAALQAVKTTADYIVLCDADMVFLRPLPLADLAMTPRTISFDGVSYLRPDDPRYAAEIAHACRGDHLDPAILRNPVISGGVPHVIPTRLQTELSRQWLRYIDLFPVIDHPAEPSLPRYAYPKGPHRPWLATMWAILLARHRLQLRHVETSWCISNRDGQQPMPSLEYASDPYMLHYCFDGAGFNKRDFKWNVEITDPTFWSVPPGDSTIGGFLRQQFRDTGRFFSLIGDPLDHENAIV